MRRSRYDSNAVVFIPVASLINSLLYHQPLYSFATANLDGFSFNGLLTLSTLFVAVFMVTALILLLLLMLSRRLVKPVCMLMALGNSIALYFVVTYDVVLDKSMMGNVANTNLSEAASYLHPKLLLYLMAFGVLPCVLLAKFRIHRPRRSRVALHAFLTLVLGLAWIYLTSSTWLWIDKNAKKLGGMVLPWSYVANMARYQTMLMRRSQTQTLLPPATFAGNEKTVVVLVIGEAARAENFSLYGYPRPTNPLLAESGAIPLRNSIACSTYTTASLRCILSHTNSSSEFAEQYEPLPSYLQRHGIDVVWRTNNWGEPPVDVESYQRARELREDCRDQDCQYDEVLLRGLSERIRASRQRKVFVVLHQRGSHGPSYYAEYPPHFEVFKPVCKSVELDQCASEELVNAYDNTILYTDYFLSQAIELLRSLDNTSAVLMYLSDHGESLGEHGLYLHGTPFALAPDVQKDIPFIVWASDEFMDRRRISLTDFRQRDSYSQRNVFHSVMGAFDMRSDVYDIRLDIFSPDAGPD